MTCKEMLDRMLEADLAELEAQGESPIAFHLRECERCRAIAAQLVRDTRDLARWVPSVDVVRVRPMPHRSSVRPARAAVIIGVAAALVVVMVRSRHRPSTAMHPGLVVMQPVTASSSPSAQLGPDASPGARTTAAVSAIPRRSRPTGRISQPVPRRDGPNAFVTAAVTVERTVVAPAERPVAVMPVRLSPSLEPPLGDTVSVDPPPGKRADIIRTDRPGVTVVWLYPAQRTQQ